jgi:hypothetical protein
MPRASSKKDDVKLPNVAYFDLWRMAANHLADAGELNPNPNDFPKGSKQSMKAVSKKNKSNYGKVKNLYEQLKEANNDIIANMKSKGRYIPNTRYRMV